MCSVLSIPIAVIACQILNFENSASAISFLKKQKQSENQPQDR